MKPKVEFSIVEDQPENRLIIWWKKLPKLLQLLIIIIVDIVLCAAVLTIIGIGFFPVTT